MFKKSNLDEMQEQKLLRIEHNGYWLAFWGLLIAMSVQMVMSDFEFSRIAGEWIVFMILALYMAFDCAQNGIWDRHLKYDGKTNLIISLVAAVIFAVFMFGVTMVRFHDRAGMLTAAVVGGIGGAFVFAACFLAMTLAARYTKKRQQKLEEEPEEDE